MTCYDCDPAAGYSSVHRTVNNSIRTNCRHRGTAAPFFTLTAKQHTGLQLMQRVSSDRLYGGVREKLAKQHEMVVCVCVCDDFGQQQERASESKE